MLLSDNNRSEDIDGRVDDVLQTGGAESSPQESTTWFQRMLPGPAHVKNIILSELCERFSWYGLRAILVLYFVESLGWSENFATSMFAYSAALAYFMPLLGGIVSDQYLGKYSTILYFSAVYCGGSFLLSVTAIDGLDWGAIAGLVFIAIGTGGIKPCVSSFGAEQFVQADEHAITSYFHAFYFAINCGSVGSFIITPIVRHYLGYGAAFGLPCVLLFVATLIFFSARRKYTNVPPQGSAFVQILRNIWKATYTNRNEPLMQDLDGHWLARAHLPPRQHNETLVVIKIMTVFGALPTFWMLYDQQGSAWTLQANRMDMYGLEPEQVGVLNPILIMLLIPVFEKWIYPFARRSGYELTALRRIGIGMLFTITSFIASAFVEMSIQSQGDGQVSILLQIPQILLVTIGEILISITCLEFAFSQAPVSLKGTIMSLFLLTTAIGDLLAGVIYNAAADWDPVALYFMFATLMLLNFFRFLYIAKNYETNDNNYHALSPDGASAVELEGATRESKDEFEETMTSI